MAEVDISSLYLKKILIMFSHKAISTNIKHALIRYNKHFKRVVKKYIEVKFSTKKLT